MLYFLTDTYRWIKLCIALIGLLFGIVVVAYGFGAQSSVPIIAGGFIMITMSIFLFIDGSKILKDLKKEISNLQGENSRLAETSNDLEDTSKQLKTQIKDNKIFLDQSKKLVDRQKKQIEEQSLQLETFQKSNRELTSEITRLTELHTNMKKIILTLAQTMDQSKNLEKALSKNLDRLERASASTEKTAVIMTKLTNDLKNIKFAQIDTDQDGIITRIEWDNYFS